MSKTNVPSKAAPPRPSATAPALDAHPMHTFDKLEGIEAYEFKSRLRAAQGRRHVVSRYDGEPWRIAPADISLGIDLTPRQARVYAAEVGELAAFAVGLGQIEAPTTTTGEAEPGQGLQ